MTNILKDFTPTKENLTLHGLGFLQLKLPANRRLHVWHPNLPRRACYEHSPVHNHRFSFYSTVLIGAQVNQRCDLIVHPEGTNDLISHDGPRRSTGSRESFVAGRVNVQMRDIEVYTPGQSYHMPELQYHHTPNTGVVVTLMEKLSEGSIHACSVIERPYTFDQEFDRLQLSQEQMWAFVSEALAQ